MVYLGRPLPGVDLENKEKNGARNSPKGFCLHDYGDGQKMFKKSFTRISSKPLEST